MELPKKKEPFLSLSKEIGFWPAAIVGLLVVVVVLLILVTITLWQAFATSLLWQWFVVGAFALPEIGTLQFAGVYLLLKLARLRSSPREPGEFKRLVLTSYFAPLAFIVVGWIIKAIA